MHERCGGVSEPCVQVWWEVRRVIWTKGAGLPLFMREGMRIFSGVGGDRICVALLPIPACDRAC